MNIYVANIPFKATDEDLKELFEEYGEVKSARIIVDKYTQKSRGFGFVEMDNHDESTKAIETLNGAEFMGMNLVVNEARPKTDDRGSRGRGYNSDRRSSRRY